MGEVVSHVEAGEMHAESPHVWLDGSDKPLESIRITVLCVPSESVEVGHKHDYGIPMELAPSVRSSVRCDTTRRKTLVRHETDQRPTTLREECRWRSAAPSCCQHLRSLGLTVAIIERPAPTSRPPTVATPSTTYGVFRRPLHTAGWKSWLFTVDHKKLGIMYGVAAFAFFLIG